MNGKLGGDGFVEVLAATQTPDDKEWFQGTADAVRQYSWLIGDTKNKSVEDVVILSGAFCCRLAAFAPCRGLGRQGDPGRGGRGRSRPLLRLRP